MSIEAERGLTDLAVVGLAGRFPGAASLEAFWARLREGVGAVTALSDEALRAKGVSQATLDDPAFVKSTIPLEGVEEFDAAFFGYSPAEAARIDPQQRLFLECAWEALEHAGYGDALGDGWAGVYAGCGANTYLLRHLLPAGGLHPAQDTSALLGLLTGNEKDSLTTRVAYKLNLRGPAITIQTACSTSLVAVHLACRSLLHHEVDLALAGGVWVNLLHRSGYRYEPGAILSPDGLCRAFDAQAAGTVMGSGAGVVVLKRLSEALADGDTIHALIKGSAVNNDGSGKMGYTAPSLEGQAEVILAAHAFADVAAETLSYVEAHGTGTIMGDPIEVAALTRAFRSATPRRGFCALGSVKTNIGHLDAAAGVAGLIKTILALQHQTLPPSLHFSRPNPQIDFEGSPFYVNTAARPWPAGPTPRRAAVSSFGLGGTNAHVVLEEAPPAQRRSGSDDFQVLPVSARTATSLQRALERLSAHLRDHPGQSLRDIAWTLQSGRRPFEHRVALVCRDRQEALDVLERRPAHRWASGVGDRTRTSVAFLFPGQGAQQVNMAAGAYREEAVFRDALDRCCELLRPALGRDLRAILYPSAADVEEAEQTLAQTAITQPALLAVEYALAQQWIAWGVQPAVMLGHSLGQYVAACVAGVFTLEEAVRVVAARGALVHSVPPGAMLAVAASEASLAPCLGDGCDLAAVNGPDLCVLSGSDAAIARAEERLRAQGLSARRLRVSHAFHSAMLDPILGAFEAQLRTLALRAPCIPIVCNLTGRLLTAQEATDPQYWVRHLRQTVRFDAGVRTLLAGRGHVLLEVGPGTTLGTLVRRQGSAPPVLASWERPSAAEPEQSLRAGLARLWAGGAPIDWRALHGSTPPGRVPLPTYAFDRQRHWVEAADAVPPSRARLYVPQWQPMTPVAPIPTSLDMDGAAVLVLGAQTPAGRELVSQLREAHLDPVVVEAGVDFRACDPRHYVVRAAESADYDELLGRLRASGVHVGRVLHLWNAGPDSAEWSWDTSQQLGFYSVLALARSLAKVVGRAPAARPVDFTVVGSGLAAVSREESVDPQKATLLGACRVVPQEYAGIDCHVVDVPAAGVSAQALWETLFSAERPSELALRADARWRPVAVPFDSGAAKGHRLRRGGTYLIVGGRGGIGQHLAEELRRSQHARVAVIGRSPPPAGRESDREPVLALQADVTDERQLRAAVEAVRRRWGAIHGVIQAAGVAGGGLIGSRTRESMEQVFAPKVQGTRVLLSVLAEEPLDFLLLCSSMTAVTGAIGQSDYCAANAYLDALAHRWAGKLPYPVVSVNWDTWRDTGMAAGLRLPPGHGLTSHEATDAFRELAGVIGVPQVWVTRSELAGESSWPRAPQAAEWLPLPAAAAPLRRPRPSLPQAAEPPEGELDTRIADIWCELLGFESVGVRDSLFDLGGDSLLAVQLLSRVRARFAVDLPPADFLEQPTIAGLAALVEERLVEEIEHA